MNDVFEGFTFYRVNDIGDTPARVHRPTKRVFLNDKIWDTLPAAYQKVILLHEAGHANLNTRDEVKADRYALEHFANTEPMSLKNTLNTLLMFLDTQRPGHQERIKEAIIGALEIDYRVNNNQKAKSMLDNALYYDGYADNSYSDFKALKKFGKWAKKNSKKIIAVAAVGAGVAGVAFGAPIAINALKKLPMLKGKAAGVSQAKEVAEMAQKEADAVKTEAFRKANEVALINPVSGQQALLEAQRVSATAQKNADEVGKGAFALITGQAKNIQAIMSKVEPIKANLLKMASPVSTGTEATTETETEIVNQNPSTMETTQNRGTDATTKKKDNTKLFIIIGVVVAVVAAVAFFIIKKKSA
jgi:hypothetical protein